jgi:hypothetical protein
MQEPVSGRLTPEEAARILEPTPTAPTAVVMVEPEHSNHKAYVGAAFAAVSAIAGLIVGMMQFIDVNDMVTVTGQPVEHVSAWWKIILAVLTVLAGGAATGGMVWQTRNKPKL